MNKTDLIDKIAAKTGATKKDVGAILDAYFATVSDALAAGDSVQIIGFGTFSVKKRAARTGRNPLTKATIQIPASKHVAFAAGKGLKDKLN